MVKIRNSNFITSQMSLRDISYTFVFKGSAKDFTYKTLIEEGYIKKHLRYFAPTDKLLDLAFVPTFIVLDEHQRRWFTCNNNFFAKEAIEHLGEEQIFKRMVKVGMFKITTACRYRKSEGFEELLTEGETTFRLREDENEYRTVDRENQ
jgi:hypothetical protein